MMEVYQIEEPKKEKTIVVGIDFGTTNSLVSYIDLGVPQVLSDEHNRRKIPSTIAITKEGNVIVGTKAVSLIGAKDTVVIKSIKRFIGKQVTDCTDSYLKEFMINNGDGNLYFSINGRQLSVLGLASEVFKRLRDVIDFSLGKLVVDAVITVPAYFDEVQRRVVKLAADMAGINVIRIINEPTAAALAYRLDKIKVGTYVVYDFGGGTFDVSILKIRDGIFKVIATGGDANLGGDDIDHAIAKYLSSKFCSDSVTDLELLESAREVKEELSIVEQVTVERNNKKIVVTKQEIEVLIRDIIDNTIEILKDTMERAKMTQDAIDGIILAGGSTRIPLIEKKIAEVLPGKSMFKSIDPDEVVAMGAAMQAHNLKKNTGDLLLDVTPLSLGLELMGGMNEKIIPRNSTIPISVSKVFTTYEDGQTGLKLHIVQGESDLVKNCRSLAVFELSGMPLMKAGDPRILVTFTIDSEGLLTVTAQEKSAGISQSIEVVPNYGLTIDNIKDAVLNVSDDYTAEKKLAESRIYAKQISAKVAKSIRDDNDLLTDDEYVHIYSHLDHVNHLVASGQGTEIDLAVNALEESIMKFSALKRNKSVKVR